MNYIRKKKNNNIENSMMLKCIVIVSVFVTLGASNAKLIKNVRHINDNIKMEMHQVTTSDLYILTVFRLSNLKNNIRKNQYSVLMFHGLMQSSDRFIEHGRNLSLAYDLVDAGFDVWLGNNRGNKYSRHHVYLNPDDPEDKYKFFNFTYEDIGKYDVAATVDYILGETKTKQLHYIGHSQGGTVFFALNSLRPKYNEKFLTANLLAGAGYQKHFSNPALEILSWLADQMYALLLAFGYVEVFPSKSRFLLSSRNTIDDLVDHCLSPTNFQNLCQILRSSNVLGTQGMEGSWFAGGGAVKEMIHFGQNVRLKRFCRWDYGGSNKQVYGIKVPPSYDLGLVTVHTTLHFGMGDTLVNYKDVANMANDMPNVRTRKVARVDFGHSDFTDALDAKELVYDYIIDTLLHYEGDIKPEIVEKNSPVYLSIIKASNPFKKINSNLFASIKSDSPITLISSFTTSAPNPSDIEKDVPFPITRKSTDFSIANISYSLPRNESNSLLTNILDSLFKNISKTSQSNLLHSLSLNSLDTPKTNVLDSLTTKNPNPSHENNSDLITSKVPNSSHANNLDSITINGVNASKAIRLNSLATNKSDILDRYGLNFMPKKNFRRKFAKTNVLHSSLKYNSDSLPITIPATSTKSYINTTLLITAIFTLKLVINLLSF